jgi:NitT/TauT family transport system permease protein
LIFVIVHSVLWPLALNTYAGFRACRTPCAWRAATMAERPAPGAAHPRAGRLAVHRLGPEDRLGLCLAHLIAAELVFGTTSGQGGLGWYIFQNRNELYTDKVFGPGGRHRHRLAGGKHRLSQPGARDPETLGHAAIVT